MSKFIVMQLELYYNKADILFHGGEGKQTQIQPKIEDEEKESVHNASLMN